MMKADITINGNIIGGRQGWAYICNSTDVPVLKADVEKEQKYEGLNKFEKVRVVAEHRNHNMVIDGTLEAYEGKWSIISYGVCISADFGFGDMMDDIENANAPIVNEGKIVAVALFNRSLKYTVLMMFKVGKVNPHCQTIADLIPLTDEEMQELKADAERWCNR